MLQCGKFGGSVLQCGEVGGLCFSVGGLCFSVGRLGGLLLQCGEVGVLCFSVERLGGLCFSVGRLGVCASVWGGWGSVLQCGEVGGLCFSVGRLGGLCFSVGRLVLCASVLGGVGFVLQCGEFGRGGESSVQDDIHRSCPKVAFEMVPMFVGLTIALSRKIVEHFHLRGFSPLLDSAMPMALWQQEGSQAPQHLRSSVVVALPSSLSALSFPFALACPGQYIHRTLQMWMSAVDTCQSGFLIPLGEPQ